MHRDDTFQKHSLRSVQTRSTYHHYHQLSAYLSSCNLCSQGRAHMPCGCTGSFSTQNISNLFVPGWPSTSVIHKVNHINGPCVTTQHKSIQEITIPPTCFIHLVVLLIKNIVIYFA